MDFLKCVHFFGWDESILLIFYYFRAEGRGEFVMKAVIHISLIVIDTMDRFCFFCFHIYLFINFVFIGSLADAL